MSPACKPQTNISALYLISAVRTLDKERRGGVVKHMQAQVTVHVLQRPAAPRCETQRQFHPHCVIQIPHSPKQTGFGSEAVDRREVVHKLRFPTAKLQVVQRGCCPRWSLHHCQGRLPAIAEVLGCKRFLLHILLQRNKLPLLTIATRKRHALAIVVFGVFRRHGRGQRAHILCPPQ